jgi:uncharacterized protein (DUF427 family)
MALRMKRHLMGSATELRFEPVSQRVRAVVAGRVVIDSVRGCLVWEPRRIVPVFAFPPQDIDADLVPVERTAPDLAAQPAFLGPGQFGLHTTDGEMLSVRTAGSELEAAAFRPADPDLDGRVAVDFEAFDSWLEEEQELVGHPHDPFKRIDTLVSSRHVVVSLDGQTLADSSRPTALLETHLPTRWYLPRDDVRMDLLVPSDHRSTCAYKGHASYFSTADGRDAGRDIAWTYTDPRQDAEPVRDRVCFWSERTDLAVDGQLTPRPVTPWSSPAEQRAAAPDSLELG